MKKVIVFLVNGQNYCMDLKHVGSITEYIKPTPIPNSSKNIEGIINIRGEIYTVLNASNILGVPEQSKSDSRIILLDVDSKISLHVEETSNVLNIEEKHIQAQSTLLNDDQNSHILNVINYEDQIILELDIQNII